MSIQYTTSSTIFYFLFSIAQRIIFNHFSGFVDLVFSINILTDVPTQIPGLNNLINGPGTIAVFRTSYS